jgi:hypothetical protein
MLFNLETRRLPLLNRDVFSRKIAAAPSD